MFAYNSKHIPGVYDAEADALYIKITDNPIVAQAAVTDAIIVDLDSGGSVVGLEVLYPAANFAAAQEWATAHGIALD